MVNVRQATQRRLGLQVIKLLPAQVVFASLHVANAQLPQMLFKKRNVLKEELLLQILSAGGDNHPLPAANRGQQISKSLSRSGTGLDDQVLALLYGLLHGFRHLQLAPPKFIMWMRVA